MEFLFRFAQHELNENFASSTLSSRWIQAEDNEEVAIGALNEAKGGEIQASSRRGGFARLSSSPAAPADEEDVLLRIGGGAHAPDLRAIRPSTRANADVLRSPVADQQAVELLFEVNSTIEVTKPLSSTTGL
ncbi:hypothetical protein [Methylorubrum extorquens]|uniref:hypothetical protein n=1 Tax=Methylorubrum extorquens TaxID=408 RepID=UPI00209EADFA|nr:hypothetical protein [Methylorubrum extorquens]MCP1537674.1 hypothetical protein [Methylorubrum extorquens]